MSCSILSMRIIIFDIQLKIITQNKRKRPKPCFFEKHTSVLPSSRALFFFLFCFTCVCTLCSPLPCSASWFFFHLEEDCGACLGVCCTACSGGRAKEPEWLFSFLLSPWCEGRVEGWTWQCWLPLPRDVSWRVAGLCADTRGPPCSCFSGSISSVLWTDGSLMRRSRNLVMQVENVIILFFPAELHLPGFTSLAWQAFTGRGKKHSPRI